MFHTFPKVCIVFCVIAKYIRINFINRLNVIVFLMRAEGVLCEAETKCSFVIQANVVLQNY